MNKCIEEVRIRLTTEEQKLSDLFSKRKEVSKNIYKEKDGTKTLMHDEHEFSVEEIQTKIESTQSIVRTLRFALMKANIETTIPFKPVDGAGDSITLFEAIALIKQLRSDYDELVKMGEMKTISQVKDPTPRMTQSTVDKSYNEISEPTFNTKAFRNKAQKMQVMIDKLELLINKANLNTEIEVDVPDVQVD